ncbi:MAG: PAS domain-containing protein, partial [Hymenobacteraceae bacterium]|nr:PAS domain-containing protein [Hymenobacteraceae bacterium]MDX5395219.1 PAS domain-containing protein [Hymenobacteraceae bacterium]MDX5442691.1 PAS domain-containing protein [Hymenobacteraceae bacterium]MDX5511257.1 PAS domain-containing protein [Hymenobacteraceae bacterium]
AFANNSITRNSPLQPSASYARELSSRQLMQHNFSELLNETLLAEYGYAAVYIDEHYDVLHGIGRIKNFLDLPEQHFTFNLLKLVPSDLSINLGTLLRKAIRDKEKVSAQGIQVRDGDSLRFMNVVVKPFLTEKKLFQKLLLVIFSEDRPQLHIDKEQITVLSESHYEERVQELEIELQHTKEDLQAVVEELETSNEELQSTNEELLSSNEELQSTNEELQSLNEELHTINAEHQYKIKALMELDDDLNNYFRSTDIGQIFVDRKLIIRKYTPAATQLINLIESDIGRSIYHISNNLRYENLIEDIRHVIATTNIVEKELQDKNGIWFQMRILPYITQEHKIDGAIVIFIQINELKNLQLLHAGIVDSSPNAIIALKALRDRGQEIVDFEVTALNHKAQELFDGSEAALIGESLWKQYPNLLKNGLFEQLVQVVQTNQTLETEMMHRRQNEQVWLQIIAVKFGDGLLLTLLNITTRKQNEQRLLQQQEEIKEKANQFRTMLEAFPHITWTNTPSGENSSFNHYWYEYTGLTPEESADWGWMQAFHPDDLEAQMPIYKETLRTGNVLNLEARIFRKADQKYRWHLFKNVPIRDEAGHIQFWIGTATDIQEQKEAEMLKLKQQREILTAVLQTQENERNNISEALHNGLGQMLYAAKLSVENFNDSTPQFQEVKDKLNKLLNESIAVMRNITFELSPSILRDFGFKVAVQEIASRLSSPNLEIKTDLVDLDKRLDYNKEITLYRIIQELLNNVMKHASASKAVVKLKQAKNKLILTVQDNGAGINKKQLVSKNGIGLSTIQNRVDMLDGKMEIKSVKGKGTKVTITIKDC